MAKVDSKSIKPLERKEGADGSLALMEDSSGRYHVLIDLRGERIYAPYAGKTALEPDIFDLVEEAERHSALRPLSLDVKIEEERLGEKDAFRHLYVRHYEGKIQENKRDAVRSRIMVLILFFIGLLFLAGQAAATYFVEHLPVALGFLPEVLSIIAWVFIWAATEEFFFKMHQSKMERKLYHRLKEAEITYYVERNGK